MTKLTLKRGKECRHSVRFETDDERAPVTNVYVSRELAGVNDAKEITVTVEVGGTTATKSLAVSDEALLAALK